MSPEHSDIAHALEWAAGVPDAEVRVHRFGTDFAWEVARTDAEGVARLPDLVTGRYRVAVYRPLTNGEAAQAATNTLGGGRILNVSGDGTEASLDLRPNEPGSLVISEVYATGPTVAEVRYDFHMFFEVYNNSDQTVLLDGLIWGTTLGVSRVESPISSCEESRPFREDPEGLWAHFLHRFPGGGSDHPLAPGEAAVVALDAIDHSTVDPRFPDLSDADFELLGSGDVDNPDVPNLVEVGIRPFPLAHGLRFFISHVLFISAPLDPSTLARQQIVNSDFFRIPAESLIDVVWTEDDDALEEQQFENCGALVHESFDQLGGGFVKHGNDLTLSVQRIALPGFPGKLQDTNVSAVDLIKGPITPGTVPR